MRDSGDAVRIVEGRADKSQAPETHVQHGANCARNVYDVLRFVQDDDEVALEVELSHGAQASTALALASSSVEIQTTNSDCEV